MYSKQERSVHRFGSYFVYNGQANITSLVGSSLGKKEGGGVCLQPFEVLDIFGNLLPPFHAPPGISRGKVRKLIFF